MIKFWKYLHKLSEKKIRESHLAEHHNDIKCSKCNQWYSITGLYHNHEYREEYDWGWSTVCGNCKHKSYWNAVAAPILLQSDENGTPL